MADSRDGGSKDREPSSGRARVELERTLGLKEVFAIGVGTMIGHGAFVFPGMVGVEAGRVAVGRVEARILGGGGGRRDTGRRHRAGGVNPTKRFR